MLQSMRAMAEVAHLGSFTAAAKSMKMSTPSISRMVSELEADLGVRLFNRTTRSIAITDAGQLYLHRCETILEEIMALRDTTRERHSNPSGTLVINSVSSFGMEVLSPIIPEFLSRYPDVSVDLRIGNRTVDLIEEHVDVAIRIGTAHGLPDSSLVATKIYEQKMIFVAAPKYLEKYGEPKTIADLSQRNFITMATGGWGHVHTLMTNSGEIDFKLPSRFVVDSPRACVTAALAGHGCTLLPHFTARRALADGSLQRILPDIQSVPYPIYAVYAHRSYVAARIRLFIDFMVDAIKS